MRTKKIAKQILLVVESIKSANLNDDEQKILAREIMADSTSGEVDNLIDVLALTDPMSPKYLVPKASDKMTKDRWGKMNELARVEWLMSLAMSSKEAQEINVINPNDLLDKVLTFFNTTKDKYQKAIDDFDDVEVIEGDVKVVFTYLGEGLSGEYGESEDDVPLLRFDIYKKDYVDYGIEHPDWNWDALESGSYCTTIVINTPKETLEKMAQYILDQVKDDIAENRSIRSVAAGLSHISEDDIE